MKKEETLKDIYPPKDAEMLTSKARAFTKDDVEKIFHGDDPGSGVSMSDIKSVYHVATVRTNQHQPMFCFSQDLNLKEGTANCHTCY